jgi:hypothetical protein
MDEDECGAVCGMISKKKKQTIPVTGLGIL